MAGATTTTHSALVKPEVAAEVSDAVFRNSDFIPIFRQVPAAGSTHQIKVVVAANGSAQVFVEDAAVPAAGYQQVITASANYKDFRVLYRITGHLRRQLGATWDSASWPGAYGGVDIELQKAKEDMVDLVNTTFMDTGVYGLQGIVDASTNYYDQSRTTYAALKSFVKGSAGALSTSLLHRLITSTYDAPYGGRIQLLLMSPAQARKYGELISGKMSGIPGAQDIAGANVDMMAPFGGARVLVIRDLEPTTIYGLSDLNTAWYVAVHEPAPGGIDVLPYGVMSDSHTTQICTSLALICTAPNRQGSLEGLGTT